MGLLRDFNLLCQFNLQSMFEKPTVQNYICLVAAFSARVPSFVFIPRLRASDTESIQFCRFQTETQNCTDVSAFINITMHHVLLKRLNYTEIIVKGRVTNHSDTFIDNLAASAKFIFDSN